MITNRRMGLKIWRIQRIKIPGITESKRKPLDYRVRQRVGIIPLGLDVPKNPVFMWASGLGTFRVTVFATDEIVPLGLQPNLKIA